MTWPSVVVSFAVFPERSSEVPGCDRLIRMDISRIGVLAIAGMAFTAMSTSRSVAQDDATQTLEVGAEAPDFELMDSAGASWRLSDLVTRGPVVLEFFRSGDW